MAKYAVLLDACVLYPFTLRDLLIQIATTGLYRARWTGDIHNEWMSAVIERGGEVTQVEHIRDLMNLAVPDACIEGYEPLVAGIKEQGLPDENDAHVIAAAVRGNVDMIVTWNLKDFPPEITDPYDIEVQDPDDFLLNQFGMDAARVLQSVKECRSRLIDPAFDPVEYLSMIERNQLTNFALELKPYAEAKLI